MRRRAWSAASPPRAGIGLRAMAKVAEGHRAAFSALESPQPDPKVGIVGPPELLDGEGPQLPRTTWLWSEPAPRSETAATSLGCPPLPLPIEPPEGAVGDGDVVAGGVVGGGVVGGGVVGVGVVGVGVGDMVVGSGVGEHEADGATLLFAAGWVLGWCVGLCPWPVTPDDCGEPAPFFCGAGFPLEPWPPPE